MKRLVLFAVLLLIAGACGDDGGVSVQDPWARNSANMQDAGAAYMTIVGGDEADRLLGAAVAPDIAGRAELHETSMDDAGMMQMQQVTAIDIPAGSSVALLPGGYHVMMMLASPLEAGDTFDLTLTFENAGEIVVEVEVRES